MHSQQLEVQLSDAPLAQGGRTWLVANGLLQDFRALLVELDWEPGMPLYLDRTTAEALASAKAPVCAWWRYEPGP